MRIISGSARGRRLHSPRGDRVRPTSDRVKEAIFNIIISREGSFEGLRVLDLFAGTGNLGIEALSRGAAQAVFVDSSRDSAQFIRKNLEMCRFEEQGEVVIMEAAAAIDFLERKKRTFDLVFLDPPYHTGAAKSVLERLSRSAILGEGALVAAETDIRDTLAGTIGNLAQIDRRDYGDTAVTFLAFSPGD